MKVAFIASSFFPNLGGAEIQLHNLILGLRELKGVHATCYIPAASYQYLKQDGLLASFPYRLKPLKPLLFRWRGLIGLFLNKRFLVSEQEKEKYDCWHANGTYPAGYLVKDFVSVPTIVIAHGEDLQKVKELGYGLRLKRYLDVRIRKSLLSAAKCVAISSTMFDEMQGLGVLRERIERIPNFIMKNRFENEFNQKEFLRESLGLPKNKTILLTVGRNHPKKGYDLIPKILSKIMKKNNDVFWVVLGADVDLLEDKFLDEHEGSYSLRVLNEESTVSSEIYTQLPSQTIISYYHAADLFLFPSLLESFGVVLLEAMASGLPVVAFDVAGSRDVIQDGVDGCLVYKNTDEGIDQFAITVIDLIMNPNKCDQLAIQGRQKVEKIYDLPKIVDSYFKLYQSLGKKK